MHKEQFFKHPQLPFVECRCSINSSRHFKPHIHHTLSIGAIDSGEVVYQVAGKEEKLTPGQLALINPEIVHACNPSGDELRSYYMLHLDVDWCLSLQQSLWETKSFCPVTQILINDESLYQEYIQTLDLMMANGDLMEKEQQLIELVETIFFLACDPQQESNSPPLPIGNIKQQLALDLDRDICFSQLAQNIGANPYTLLRQFKTALGMTPHAYRLNCRIVLARKLLQTGVSLAETAVQCGFFDQSHFHRHFKAITSVTPREYQINFVQ